MWELDYIESWVPKNWCFWITVLKKTLESPLDCKEIKPLNRKGNQSWIFIGRTDVGAETPILWPPDAKNWLIRKDSDAGKDRRQSDWNELILTEYIIGIYLLNKSRSKWTMMHLSRKWQPTPVFLPGKSHGEQSLAGYSPWGRKELDNDWACTCMLEPWYKLGHPEFFVGNSWKSTAQELWTSENRFMNDKNCLSSLSID